MTAADFTNELNGRAALGFLSTEFDADWQAVAYAQFLRDDSVEDAIYERLP
jgi:hypothetical protein